MKRTILLLTLSLAMLSGRQACAQTILQQAKTFINTYIKPGTAQLITRANHYKADSLTLAAIENISVGATDSAIYATRYWAGDQFYTAAEVDAIISALPGPDGNNYVTTFSYNSGTGVATIGRNGLSSVTASLDGRHVKYSDTATMLVPYVRGSRLDDSTTAVRSHGDAVAAAAQAYSIQRANHTGSQAQSTVTNLVTDLAAKAPLASPALTGTPTAPTATAGTNTTQIATTQFVTTAGATKLNVTDTAAKWISNIFRIPGKDSIFFVVGSTVYAIRDSVGSGGAGDIVNGGQNGQVDIGTNNAASFKARTNGVVRQEITSAGHYLFGGATDTWTYNVAGVANFQSTLFVDGNLNCASTTNLTALILANEAGTGTRIATVKPSGQITDDDPSVLPEYLDNAAALAASRPLGSLYRTGDIVKQVH